MINKRLKIAQIAPSGIPIRSDENKAIYSHIGSLTDELVKKRHKLTLFANHRSVTLGQLVSANFTDNFEGQGKDSLTRYEQWELLSDCYAKAHHKEFDIIHSHLTVMTGFFSSLEKKIPTLISIHSPIEEWMKPILLKHKDGKFISFSLAQRKQLPELHWYANIYHGVDTDKFAFEKEPEDYVLFIGRITHDKGAHIAIEAAKETGIPIRVAGRSYSTEGYWHEMIEPHINGSSVRYFGEVSLAEKIPLIQKAKAIIFPVLWQEPFGYVLIEAMSCGTPVIAFPNGSVPEIVKDGVTGFLVNDKNGIVEALAKIDTLDRKKVRDRAEQFFSLKKMVSHYESVYRRLYAETKYKATKNNK